MPVAIFIPRSRQCKGHRPFKWSVPFALLASNKTITTKGDPYGEQKEKEGLRQQTGTASG